MGIQRKRIWLALTLAIVAGAGGSCWWMIAHAPPPQDIAMPNGDVYRFAGVTYGTNAVPPSLLIRLGNLQPAWLAKYTAKYTGPRVTYLNPGQKNGTPAVMVWFKRMVTNAPPGRVWTVTYPTQATLADQTGIQAGEIARVYFTGAPIWTHFDFRVVPKRSRMLQCNLDQLQTSGGTVSREKQIGSVRFANPLYGSFPQWQPEADHLAKQAGDTGVQFDGLYVSGGIISMTAINLSLNSIETTSSYWVVNDVELSNATGNSLSTEAIHVTPIKSYQGVKEVWTSRINGLIQGALWPDEAAWRLKVDLRHTNGYALAGLVTFTNVPVPGPGSTSAIRLTNTVEGIQIVLVETTRVIGNAFVPGRGSDPSGLEIRLQIDLPTRPAGMALDIIAADINQGSVTGWRRLMDNGYSCSFILPPAAVPANIQTMDVTLAVQKTRSVEFLVKPPRD